MIFALATPLGQSALAVIRTSGSGCIEAMAKVLDRPEQVLRAQGNSTVHAWLQDKGEKVDEVMLAVFRSPKSFSGEDSIEIYCHGSVPGIEKISGLLLKNGFRSAMGGEFSLRAFLNGKLDLTQAEAIHEIVKSQSREAHSQAIHRLSGGIRERIDHAKSDLVKFLAFLSVQLDYAEDEVDVPELDITPLIEIGGELEKLAGTYVLGRRYQYGVKISLAGKTNAGKSSLFNALLREDRAIVSDVHGTTRDVIEAHIVISGVPVRLYDTAGLRESPEAIESIGIQKTNSMIKDSRFVVYVYDGQLGFDETDEKNLAEIIDPDTKILFVCNKIDIGGGHSRRPLGRVVDVSAKDGKGLEDLLGHLSNLVHEGQAAHNDEVLIDSERQAQYIDEARSALVKAQEAFEFGMGIDAIALDVQAAVHALGCITGEVTTEDMLDVMFSGFCVGK